MTNHSKRQDPCLPLLLIQPTISLQTPSAATQGEPLLVHYALAVQSSQELPFRHAYKAIHNTGAMQDNPKLDVPLTQQAGSNTALLEMLVGMSSDYAASVAVREDGTLATEWVIGSFVEVTGQDVPLHMLPDYETTHPEDRLRQETDIKRTLNNEPTDTEFRSFKPDGTEYWLRVKRQPIWDEAQQRVTRYILVAQDITKRKQAEIALEESEARYKLLTSLTSDYAASIGVAEDGALTTEWVTGSFDRITGFPIFANQPVTLESTHPEDLSKQQADIARTIKNHKTVSEIRSLRPDGDIVWLRISRQPVWDESAQRVTRFYTIAQNITQQKLAESELQQSLLQKAELETIQKTVATLAHEINNPLMGVTASLQLALDPDLSEEDTADLLRQALEAARKISDVVQKIQDLRKPSYRAYRDDRKILDIRD